MARLSMQARTSFAKAALFVALLSGSTNARVLHNAPVFTWTHRLEVRGGSGHGHSSTTTTTQPGIPSTNTTTVEEYVAAVQRKDDEDRMPDRSFSSESGSTDSKADTAETAATSIPDDVSTPVGVKSHKKGNAVGDPDGEGSDDDDDTDDTDDWEEFEDLDGMVVEPTQVQMEVELVEDDELDMEEVFDDDDETKDSDRPASGGGVGVRLGQRLSRRRNRKEVRAVSPAPPSISQNQLLEAWRPYVYLPPSQDALDFLRERGRSIDGASKARLDRRTLYAGLLTEWSPGGSTYRKYLEKSTSQALQASLSLASQPKWRKSFPRPSGIRLYDSDEPNRGSTLSMQETVAMALAHSLGAGMVLLDDNTILAVRQRLLSSGHAEEEVKPALLIQALLSLAREGALGGNAEGSISACMKEDLSVGLDDPFDDRATRSVEEMAEWERKWLEVEHEKETKELPMVVFLRASGASGLLRSKSAVETLMQECNSNDGINLVVIGRGVDVTTESLPEEPVADVSEPQEMMAQRSMQGSSPWFGFSPHNQNASGQNDPEGSRRFNIFLARTVDPNGTVGILGAIAPPQAGNLFPHMMAMQARERLQNTDDDAPVRDELNRWAEMLQQQMMTNEGSPGPPPQFFNASLSVQNGDNSGTPQQPPPEVIQQTLQQAMSELLDRLSQMNDFGDSSSELSPDLHKAFAQVLRNDNLRRGIAENLARAAPALSDPKCQGVMLSVYVPPPASHANRGKLPGQSNGRQQPNMPGWFQKILNNQEESAEKNGEDGNRSRQKRVRTMAAAAAMLAARNAEGSKDGEKQENKADRNLARLENICRPINLNTPSDPVRGKAWEGWIARERGAVIFRQNRRSLNDQLENHGLSLQEHTGTRGAGSSLRQMLSVRDVSDEMDAVIKCAIELEAEKAQRKREGLVGEQDTSHKVLDVDITLNQLLVTDDALIENTEIVEADATTEASKSGLQLLHPSSLEAALSTVCRISPSPSGGLSVTLSGPQGTHRSREEIAALAQDKHERALIPQVASPQDIGVTYDMIGGLHDVKELLRQSITYPLKFPQLYSEGIAREAVKGVLLFGPPGTGKTMLAKAVATEGGASFLSVDASSVENKWLGESEKNAKAVFTLARRLAPCVIFVDEVDSLLSSREGTSDDSAHGTLTSVKTTMMSEWDGLNSGTNGSGEAGSDRVIVIGSTNRPFDLDEAVLRRFPRRILVDLPDLETRREILEVTLAENRLDSSVNLTSIADRLDGYTGSDIKEVCREAVVQISHEQAKMLEEGMISGVPDANSSSLQRLRPVTVEDFEKALTKLKRSVSEKGRELARVWEWNDEYGEIKKEKKNHLPHLANMYL